MPAPDAKELSDEELACKTQAGSHAAFEELVFRYEARVFGFLQSRTGRIHDAQDLTQKVFVRAFRKIGRYNPRFRFASWLFTIARRESIGHYRRAAVHDRPQGEHRPLPPGGRQRCSGIARRTG
jgi:RNA polymerase sigma-70 factor (ECF subfamily)